MDSPAYSEENFAGAMRNGMRMLRPDRFVVRLHQVDLDDLERRGIRGLIVDLDNTMVAYRQSEIVKEHLNWVQEARARGFAMVMLSNNFTGRVTGVAEQLQIDCIPNALKPLPTGFWRARRLLRLPSRAIAVVGDQLFTDVLGGKLLGLYTILTEPIEPHDFAITRVFRFFERMLVRRS